MWFVPDLYLVVYLMTNQNSNFSYSYSNRLPVESLLTVELTGGPVLCQALYLHYYNLISAATPQSILFFLFFFN